MIQYQTTREPMTKHPMTCTSTTKCQNKQATEHPTQLVKEDCVKIKACTDLLTLAAKMVFGGESRTKENKTLSHSKNSWVLLATRFCCSDLRKWMLNATCHCAVLGLPCSIKPPKNDNKWQMATKENEIQPVATICSQRIHQIFKWIASPIAVVTLHHHSNGKNQC